MYVFSCCKFIFLYLCWQIEKVVSSFNHEIVSPLQEASLAIPLFAPVIVPVAQSFGPLLSQLTSSPTIRLGVRTPVFFLDTRDG